jgi:protein-S-isoprenylcysteine O-methyltransferase Ste14
MALLDEFERQGRWLFRWRSYLPLMFLALVGVAFKQAESLYYTWFHECWELICLGISLLGLAIRAITVGHAPARTSGRNARRQVANELNTTGMYSIVRHPLYLGNFFIGLGISFVLFVWWLPAIYSLLFCVYYERIMFTEEMFLHRKFGAAFDDWAAATPAFWPRFSRWRRADLPFSFRNVLRREYTGLAVVILGHSAMEFAEHEFFQQYPWQTFWSVLAGAGVVIYLVLRLLKRRTTLLDVPGR